MKSKLLNMIGSGLMSLAWLSASTSVYADDTEIFFNTTANAVKPNILFIFDTSGSMNGLPSGEDRKKIEIIKEAMKAVIDEVSGVNIGMARFTASNGAAILFPVTDIDKAATPLISQTVESGANDAVQNNSGTVTIGNSKLVLANSNTNKFTALRFPSLNIPQGAKITNAVLTLFPSEENSNVSESGSLTMRIQAEKVTDSATLAATSNNISGRTKTTAFYDWSMNTWSRSYDSTMKKYIGSPEASPSNSLNSVIQEVVNQAGWCGGNALTLLIERQSGSGERTANSFEGDSARAPTLTVTFSEEPGDFQTNGTVPRCFTNKTIARVIDPKDDVEENSDGQVSTASDVATELSFQKILGSKAENAAVGLRFDKVKIPQGADVISAKLSLYSATAATGSATTLNAVGVDTGNLEPFDTNVNKLLTTGLSKTTAVALSYPVNWSTPNTEYIADGDLASIIKTIAAKADWKYDNAFGLIITHTDGLARHVWPREKGLAYAPKLTITYRGSYNKGMFLVRDKLKAATEGFKALGGTPVSDSMVEAARYFRGEAVSFGTVRGNPSNRENNVSHPDTIISATHTIPSGCDLAVAPYSTACKNEQIAGTYKTPITDTCQSNHIVLLTDGEPNQNATATNTWVKNTVGTSCKTNDGGIDCTLKATEYLKNVDQMTDDETFPGKQTISTHAVSFDLKAGSKAAQFMDDVAKAGGDEKAYVADNTQGLIDAFTTIISNIQQRSSSFVSAGVTVSQTNRLVHEDKLYFSMFQPSGNQRWSGNLKRYGLKNGVLVDQNEKAAVNSNSDQFADEAMSHWSSSVDGNVVRLGGAASKLNANRKVYTNVSSSENVKLADGNNNLHENTTGITDAMLKVATADERSTVLKWARGIDVDDLDGDLSTTDAHNIFGDPIHSRTALIRYKNGTSSEMRAYVGTNHGYLHSVDTASGSESWAFVPQDLLGNLATLRKNEPLPTGYTHGVYGLDGTIRVVLNDANKDGLIDDTASSGEFAYLVFGMRRGGKNYYVLDVTKRDAPELKYVIGPNSDGYSKIGQTWSAPAIGRIRTGPNETKRVLIFGGGYDTKQDNYGDPVKDEDIAQGNVIYVADAENGKKLWSSDESGVSMNAVPADIAVLDLDGDNLIDTGYAVDTRAQVFRMDFMGDGSVKLHKLASLHPEAATVTDNRRFYARVDPSYINRPDGESFVAVSVGTGYRAHPLNTTIKDHFYVIRDQSVLGKTAPTLVTLGGLVDITEMLGLNDDGSSKALDAIEDEDKSGWYLRLTTSGEKVMAESVTFDKTVFFTTYLPPSAAVSGCSANSGAARLYAVNVLDGMPVRDRDLDDKVEHTDRFRDLMDQPGSGMVPPQVLITDSGPILCVGNKCFTDELDASVMLQRMKWQRITSN
ncbi:hypothetical protein [Permianibacter aggregans]|uniref:Type IV pilus assembly protein PilY1 n=1 Tax=Permianibacter aggregans TaxID=1510150 RepID=A0A4R6UT90_9GAMM|nr:hypothetical protein [Permianibacter aggregans]QGX38570.1 hypothetical protein E2H98_02395 [Permianibacter aggregans]TDQ50352.1 type IV pilus assembly protein PilY1 [Permianibacter aggregans]